MRILWASGAAVLIDWGAFKMSWETLRRGRISLPSGRDNLAPTTRFEHTRLIVRRLPPNKLGRLNQSE